MVAGLAAVVVGFPAPAAAAQADLAEGQWWQTQWEMDRVWQITEGNGITVAVLDSGMDPSVPELTGAVLPGVDLIDADPEGVEHGTGMASLIAGHGGNRGFRGVAPAATILPVTVGDPELRSDVAFDVMSQGIRYAVDSNAQVINISQAGKVPLGENDCPAPIADALRYAADNDVVVVAGSGNDAGGPSPYPGSCPGVLTVGATDRQLHPWSDSHRSEHVDVAAAGVDISAIGRGGQAVGGSGTSGATALVSGAVALIRAEFPDATADEILRRVIYTAGDIHTPGRDDATGHGVVQPIHALTEPLPPDAPNPVYEQLHTNSEEPNRSLPPLRTGPGMQPAQGAQSQTGISPILFTTIVIGLLAAVVLAVVVILVVAAGRRRSAHPYPQPAQPRYPVEPPYPGQGIHPPNPPHRPHP